MHPDLVVIPPILRRLGLLPIIEGSVQNVRRQLERINKWLSQSSTPLSCEQLLTYEVNGRQVPCKAYWPDDLENPRLMFYCHGGGFRHGTLTGWDAPLRQLVRDSGVAVLSIEYALAPEHPFPTAFDEVGAVLRNVIAEGVVSGHAVSGFALGGDSAGANLALGTALALRDEGVDVLRGLTLFYGSYSKDVDSESWRRLSGYGGQGLSSTAMRTYWETYLPNDDVDWRVQPLHADLTGLPPTRLIVGDLDPLYDENLALAAKLEACGVESNLTIMPNVIHGFIRFNEIAGVVRGVIREEAKALRAFSA
tara:strand:- start:42833 stop:43756 length:924 start_codon:yes stop_codon:yes gene_type:complete